MSGRSSQVGQSSVALGFPSVGVLRNGLGLELDPLGLTIKRKPGEPLPPLSRTQHQTGTHKSEDTWLEAVAEL